MRSVFLNFLKENDIDVDKFMYLTEPKNNGFKFKKYKYIQSFFDEEPYENWIKDAFRWDNNKFFDAKTLSDLNQKWIEKISEMKSVKKDFKIEDEEVKTFIIKMKEKLKSFF